MDKVYAKVTFTVWWIAPVDILSSYDTETQIFPGTTIDVVGDGKFIKLDREPPDGDLFESGTTTVVTNTGVPKLRMVLSLADISGQKRD